MSAPVVVAERRAVDPWRAAFGAFLVFVAVGTAVAAAIGATLVHRALGDVEQATASGSAAVGSAATALEGATRATDRALGEVAAAAIDLEGSVRSIGASVREVADALGPLGGPLDDAADRLEDVADRIARVRDALADRAGVTASAESSVVALHDVGDRVDDTGRAVGAARGVVILLAVLVVAGQAVPLWLGLGLLRPGSSR